MTDLLPDNDIAYLAGKESEYHAQLEGGMITLVIHRFALPCGYQPDEVDLLLRLPLQFPEAAPDMFWVSPVVTYSNGHAPPQTEHREPFIGRTWQRWSRHFNQSPWRPGTDDLRSYVQLIRVTLEREAVAHAA